MYLIYDYNGKNVSELPLGKFRTKLMSQPVNMHYRIRWKDRPYTFIHIDQNAILTVSDYPTDMWRNEEDWILDI